MTAQDFGNFIRQRKAYNNWKGSKDSKQVLMVHVLGGHQF